MYSSPNRNGEISLWIRSSRIRNGRASKLFMYPSVNPIAGAGAPTDLVTPSTSPFRSHDKYSFGIGNKERPPPPEHGTVL